MDQVLPKTECEESTDVYGRFVVEPLEAGFGLTLGNALRRVLLSSLPGSAVTSVKLDQVQHEFSSIAHVREDASEFLLNVKAIRLRAYSDRPAKLRLEVTGEGAVSAGDIVAPADIEVVNPELHLATLDAPDARLTVEFNVERGKGYIPASHREGLAIGVIPVDAIFTPIRKVNYTVEHTRIGQVTNYDRLVLEVWTDGTITPQEAVSQSAQILTRHLGLMIDLARTTTRVPDRQPLGPPTIPPQIYETPIEDLELSVRAFNCLKRSGITKVGQVLEMNEDDLLAVRNFGRKSLDELRDRLAEKGFLAAVPGASLAGPPSTTAADGEEDEGEAEAVEETEDVLEAESDEGDEVEGLGEPEEDLEEEWRREGGVR